MPGLLGTTLAEIAGIQRDKRDYEQAEITYQQAFSILEKTNSSNKERVRIEYAMTSLETGRYDKVTYYSDLVSEGIKNNPTSIYHPYTYAMKAFAAKAKGNISSYVPYAKKTMTSYNQLGYYYLDVAIYTSMVYARALYDIRSDSAFYYASNTLDLIYEEENGAYTGQFKAGTYIEFAQYYNEAAGWFLNLRNDPLKAYQLVEDVKTRFLLQEISLSNEPIYKNAGKKLLHRKDSLESIITQLHRELANSSQGQRDSLTIVTRQAELDYEGLISELSSQFPKLRVIPNAKSLSLSEVQELLDDKSAVLEYAFSEYGLVTFLITKDDVQWRVIDGDVKNSVLYSYEDQVYAYREAIERKAPVDSLRILSQPLIESVFQGLLDEHPEVDQLIVVPDGPLVYLPFDALMGSDGRFLVEKYTIKSVPSTSILPFIKDPGRVDDNSLFAFAASEFGEEGSIPLLRSEAFTPLPYAPIEVDSIASFFSSSTVLKDEAKSEELIKDDGLDSYKYLHFATHGVMNEANASQSKLILSNREYLLDSPEDGHLTGLEINTMDINADMVVLSACNTGAGKYLKGEGLLGLQRSFLVAGASSVVASLWEVYDASTATFMTEFYRDMIDGQQAEFGWWNRTMDYFGWYEQPLFDYKAKALRQAKLDMLDHQYYSHPVYWAPFVYIGK